jgi:hypothetical protein
MMTDLQKGDLVRVSNPRTKSHGRLATVLKPEGAKAGTTRIQYHDRDVAEVPSEWLSKVERDPMG